MKRPRRGPRLVVALCAAYTVALALVALVEAAVAERHWLGTLLVYAPQALAAIPLPPLLALALLTRNRRALLWLAGSLPILLWLLGPVAHLPDRRDASLRVLTANIEHGGADVARIAAAIRAASPDIVCLQEVNAFKTQPDPLPGLQAALPGYTIVREGEVALASRLPIRHTATIRFGETFGRVALEATVAGPAGDVNVVCAHLNTSLTGERLGKRDLPGYLKRTSAVRKLQVETLAAHAAASPLPVMVCGDFNTPPRGRVYGRLTERMTDAFAAAGQGFGWTYPARRPVLRIDHIFCGPQVAPVRCRTVDLGGSDHRGMLAEVSIAR